MSEGRPSVKDIQVTVEDFAKNRQGHGSVHQKYLSLVLDNMKDIVFLLAVEPQDTYRLLYVNPAGTEASGMPVEQVTGETIQKVIGEAAYTQVLEKYQEAIRERRSVEWLETALYPSGERIMEARVIPIFEGQGRCTHLVGLAQDVTEQHYSKRALQESERQLAEAQRIARLGSWEWNVQTGAVSWSQELLRMIGWDGNAASLDSKNSWGWVHPDDQVYVRQALQSAIAKEGDFDYENRLLCPDGREINVHNWGHLVRDEAGEPLRMIAVAQDVTEQRQVETILRESQEYLQALAEAMPASIIISRMSDGTILYANPFTRQLFGVALDADLSQYTSSDFYQDPEERTETVRLLTEHAFVGPREISVKRLDGTPIWAIGSFQRLTLQGEDIVLATHHDITARKALERERERLLAEAEERADRDALTDLINHRAFQKRLEEESDLAQQKKTTLAVVMLDLDQFKYFNDVYGHGVGDEVLRMVAERLQSLCRPEDALARYGGDEFAMLLPRIGEKSRQNIEMEIRVHVADLSYHPEGQPTAIPISVSVGAALYPFDDLPWQEVISQAEERLRYAKQNGPSEAEAEQVRISMLNSLGGFSILDALVAAVDNKDRYTRRHSEDVLTYSLMIAREMGLAESEQHIVAVSALLHDVGKIGIPDAILRKPGRLTTEEYEAISQHPQMGAIIVQAVPGLEETLDAVRHHHERWDGGGYPFGLKGEETPLIARLMAVADAFSAMTTDRPYRKGITPEEALSILRAGAGTQWDPQCVQCFVQTQQASCSVRPAGQ